MQWNMQWSRLFCMILGRFGFFCVVDLGSTWDRSGINPRSVCIDSMSIWDSFRFWWKSPLKIKRPMGCSNRLDTTTHQTKSGKAVKFKFVSNRLEQPISRFIFSGRFLPKPTNVPNRYRINANWARIDPGSIPSRPQTNKKTTQNRPKIIQTIDSMAYCMDSMDSMESDVKLWPWLYYNTSILLLDKYPTTRQASCIYIYDPDRNSGII